VSDQGDVGISRFSQLRGLGQVFGKDEFRPDRFVHTG